MSYENFATRIPINAVSKTAGATASGIIDTFLPNCGPARWCTIDVIATTADVVSNKPTVLKLQEGETTDATSMVNIAGFVGGTDFTIPNANTAATALIQNSYKFNVDLRARKRYIQVSYSPATTQVVSAIANLSMSGGSPTTAAKANAMVLAEG
ncbi:hypothetical protein JQ609_04275 [Bradyrhizobium sp. AUGA SZCCT0169]|uniref:hypothetical protein n=1 Tax=Bradyrhizobium sp. AUGA SZCCT0169 TaxID=2807663 RepID=UPI001BA707EB|nr:hypothetical protein [Bradyrhizobium sp. AUGA SZCCT0169]MBR1246145.1 hypothetical protein [Bradyrhizobium sp. AUGA SZCCT0169]